ncbi:MAG: peptidase U32 family protein [Promethearchaeota archaeon]
MRAQAKNFKQIHLPEIVDFCHSEKNLMKAYLCTNILIYDSELRDLENLLEEAKEAGIDAIIAHDIAVIKLAKKKSIPFHISTQANISNVETAMFYEALGAKRINMARELSLKQISAIKEKVKKIEIECFIHGAMCTSISGRCYLSATLCDSEQFSANRGSCIQPCRREWKVFDEFNNEFIYDGQRFLNSKDLCMIEYIPQLIEANIHAFKIEGRMKDPLYVKTVCECYREALNSYYNSNFTPDKIANWLLRLSAVYNRGFHTGFYFQRPTREDIELEKSGNISPYKKIYFGKVKSYDRNSKSANLIIEKKNKSLTVGSELIIIGPDTFLVQKLNNIIYKGKKVEAIMRKETEEPIKINISLSNEVKVDDKIYIIS